MPETKLHFLLRTSLYAILELAFGAKARVGCDQFVYWNARDPKRCLAPDVFLHLGAPDCVFQSWKTWELGTPELAVEILSRSDEAPKVLGDKVERYHELGVQELVVFDPDGPAGSRVRAWDRIDEDLVERKVTADATPCVTLGAHWVVAPCGGLDALRLSHDAAGARLFPTPTERDAARIAELEAELARRKR